MSVSLIVSRYTVMSLHTIDTSIHLYLFLLKLIYNDIYFNNQWNVITKPCTANCMIHLQTTVVRIYLLLWVCILIPVQLSLHPEPECKSLSGRSYIWLCNAPPPGTRTHSSTADIHIASGDVTRYVHERIDYVIEYLAKINRSQNHIFRAWLNQLKTHNSPGPGPLFRLTNGIINKTGYCTDVRHW